MYLLKYKRYLYKFHFFRRCNNFQNDIVDSEIYSYLLKQIAPLEKGVTMEALMVCNFILICYIYFYFFNAPLSKARVDCMSKLTIQ